MTHVLESWVDVFPESPGEVHAGEVGCILRGDPDTIVGVDVVFITSEHAALQNDETTMIDGAPLLAVEILSPSDKQEDIGQKVDDYLKYGVSLVWIVDTHFQTVTVHRPGMKPELFNSDQKLSGGDLLPGFEVSVGKIF